MNRKRLIITAKDVAQVTGLSVRSAQKLLRLIKLKNRKLPWQPVSITEFATHMGLDPNEIKEVID